MAHITICGDRPRDIESQLRFLAAEGVDLIITSGGLGPTADDLTVETVARFCGRDVVLDDELEARIAEIIKPMMARYTGPGAPDFATVRAANRKQALIPAGATILTRWAPRPELWCPAPRRSWCCRGRLASCNRCGTRQ